MNFCARQKEMNKNCFSWILTIVLVSNLAFAQEECVPAFDEFEQSIFTEDLPKQEFDIFQTYVCFSPIERIDILENYLGQYTGMFLFDLINDINSLSCAFLDVSSFSEIGSVVTRIEVVDTLLKIKAFNRARGNLQKYGHLGRCGSLNLELPFYIAESDFVYLSTYFMNDVCGRFEFIKVYASEINPLVVYLMLSDMSILLNVTLRPIITDSGRSISSDAYNANLQLLKSQLDELDCVVGLEKR